MHGLDEASLVIARATLNNIRDEVYVLRCALHDADGDLRQATTTQELRDICSSIMHAARDVVNLDAAL